MSWWARKVVVGFDYWQVISHYPLEMSELCEALAARGNEMHVISAIGSGRVGTIADEVHQHWPDFPESCIHEVLFEDPKQAPELKLAKCQELGIGMFFDDRDDVCRLLNQRGILALRVIRKDGSVHDLTAERSA
jgi:hypothetical protein